jgi:hypothetical protein
MVRTLRDEIDTNWEGITVELSDLLIRHVEGTEDNADAYIEIFRRLSGFRSIVRGFIQYRIGILDTWAQVYAEREKDRYVTRRLVEHLNCNMNYYVQQFLTYIREKTDNQTIVDFVRSVLNSLYRTPDGTLMRKKFDEIFDIERTFVDKQQLIVPAYWYLLPDDTGTVDIPNLGQISESIQFKDIKPTIDNDVTLPVSDGVHLEVAQGACLLNEVPSPPTEQPAIVLKCDCACCKDAADSQIPAEISQQETSG